MANLYRNKNNNKLYTIQYLVKDIRFLNGGQFEGIYAIPYKHNDKQINHTKGNCNNYNPILFIQNNFIKKYSI